MVKRFLAVILLVLGLASCQAGREAAPEAAPEAQYPVYDYTKYDYGYQRAEALRTTNLEPAPTSYVLFPRPSLELDEKGEITETEVERFNKWKEELTERINAYCLEHYEQFDDLPTAHEKNMFGNFVTFYWPLNAEEADAKAVLADDKEAMTDEQRAKEISDKCTFLTEHYDFDRAEALLDFHFPKGIPKTKEGGPTRGPVMVLDFGFDAVVVPMDFVELRKMKNVPAYWKTTIDSALSAAKKGREDAIKDLEELDKKVAAADRELAEATSKKTRKKDLKAAKAKADSANKERNKHWKKWFSKGSWGRALACGFSGVVMEVANKIVPATDYLKKKVDDWCDIEKNPATGKKKDAEDPNKKEAAGAS